MNNQANKVKKELELNKEEVKVVGKIGAKGNFFKSYNQCITHVINR